MLISLVILHSSSKTEGYLMADDSHPHLFSWCSLFAFGITFIYSLPCISIRIPQIYPKCPPSSQFIRSWQNSSTSTLMVLKSLASAFIIFHSLSTPYFFRVIFCFFLSLSHKASFDFPLNISFLDLVYAYEHFSIWSKGLHPFSTFCLKKL